LSDDESCACVDFGLKILNIGCDIRGFRVTFGVTGDTDIEILTIALPDVLNEIDCVGK